MFLIHARTFHLYFMLKTHSKRFFLAHNLCCSITDVKYACFTHVIILILIYYMQKVHVFYVCKGVHVFGLHS